LWGAAAERGPIISVLWRKPYRPPNDATKITNIGSGWELLC